MNEYYQEKILREMQIRGWSPKTQKFYMGGLSSFVKYFAGRKPTAITLDEIKNYMLYLQSKGQGPVWINMQIFSIRFFYKYVCKPSFDVRDVPKMKVPKRFPKVFSRDEVKKIIDATSSMKERAILSGPSLHYSGNAIDLRSRDLNPTQIKHILSRLKSDLGPNYDVVDETSKKSGPHFHVEYDPKQ